MFLQLDVGVIGTKFRECRSIGYKATKQADLLHSDFLFFFVHLINTLTYLLTYLDRHVIRGLLPIHLQDTLTFNCVTHLTINLIHFLTLTDCKKLI